MKSFLLHVRGDIEEDLVSRLFIVCRLMGYNSLFFDIELIYMLKLH